MSSDSTSSAEAPLAGTWYDGRSARPRPVLVELVPGPRGPGLRLRHGEPPHEVAVERGHDTVGWPERYHARATVERLTVDLREQGTLELQDLARWQLAVESAGGRVRLAERMQTQWAVFAAVLVGAALVLTGVYRWGTPWIATRVAAHVPLGWEVGISDRAMGDLDEHLLKPSALPPARQAELRAQFEALVKATRVAPRRYEDYSPRLSLQFRKGLGANAFALPGGQLVMTDGLVEAAAKQKLPDDALAGVLAHEIGHVVHRHGTRAVVQHGIVNVALGLALGDTSWVFSNGVALLTTLHYSRRHETEADCYAIALMNAAGRPTRPMGELLLAITRERQGEKEDPPAAAKGGGWGEIFSTHPDTPERAMRLRDGTAPGC